MPPARSAPQVGHAGDGRISPKQGEAGVEIPQIAKQSIAEAFGAFVLLVIGAGSILTATAMSDVNLLVIAFAHGLAIFIGVSAVGHVSGGHFNPAVTFGFLITGNIAPLTAVAYWGSQLLGAVIGVLLLSVIFSGSESVSVMGYAAEATNLGVPALHGDISVPIGILIEAAMTFILVFVIFQVAVDEKGPSTIAPLAIGMTITLTALMSGPLTGAALNPARAFGPALISGYWTDHYVYWIGPLLGGGIGALVAAYVMQGKKLRLPGRN